MGGGVLGLTSLQFTQKEGLPNEFGLPARLGAERGTGEMKGMRPTPKPKDLPSYHVKKQQKNEFERNKKLQETILVISYLPFLFPFLFPSVPFLSFLSFPSSVSCEKKDHPD